LIDKIRPTPARSLDPLVPHPLQFAGNTAASKLALIREAMTKRSPHQDWVYILPTLPAIAWLLNIRCPGDIPYCPVAYAYLALTADRVVIFVDKRKVNDEVREQFESVNLEVKDYGVDEVGAWMKEAVKDFARGNDSVKKETLARIFAPRELSWALSTAVGSVCGSY
jgi:Xaa-Pro aminopeptidase